MDRLKQKRKLEVKIRKAGGFSYLNELYDSALQVVHNRDPDEVSGSGLRRYNSEHGETVSYGEPPNYQVMLRGSYFRLGGINIMRTFDGVTYVFRDHAIERLSERRGHHSIDRTILYMLASKDEKYLGWVDEQAFLLMIDGAFMGFHWPQHKCYFFNTFYLPDYFQERFPDIKKAHKEFF